MEVLNSRMSTNDWVYDMNGHRPIRDRKHSKPWIFGFIITIFVAITVGIIVWLFNRKKSKITRDDPNALPSSLLMEEGVNGLKSFNTTSNDDIGTIPIRLPGNILIDPDNKQDFTSYVKWKELDGFTGDPKFKPRSIDVVARAGESDEDAAIRAFLEYEERQKMRIQKEKDELRGNCPDGYRFIRRDSKDERTNDYCVQEAPEGYELALWKPPKTTTKGWFHRAICPPGMERNLNECKRTIINSQIFIDDQKGANSWCNSSRPFLGGMCRESKAKPGIIRPVDRCPAGYKNTGMYCAKCRNGYTLRGGQGERPYCALACPEGSESDSERNGSSPVCWKKYKPADIKVLPKTS